MALRRPRIVFRALLSAGLAVSGLTAGLALTTSEGVAKSARKGASQALNDLNATARRAQTAASEAAQAASAKAALLAAHSARLGRLGADIVAREARLAKTHEALQARRRAAAKAQFRLASARAELNRISIAANRVAREPTPAMLRNPERPIDAARSAMLLRLLSKRLVERKQTAQREAQNLRGALAEVEAVEASARAELAALRAEEDEVSRLRYALQRATQSADEAAAASQSRAERLARLAQSSQDLARALTRTGPILRLRGAIDAEAPAPTAGALGAKGPVKPPQTAALEPASSAPARGRDSQPAAEKPKKDEAAAPERSAEAARPEPKEPERTEQAVEKPAPASVAALEPETKSKKTRTIADWAPRSEPEPAASDTAALRSAEAPSVEPLTAEAPAAEASAAEDISPEIATEPQPKPVAESTAPAVIAAARPDAAPSRTSKAPRTPPPMRLRVPVNTPFQKAKGELLWPVAGDMRRSKRDSEPGVSFFTAPYARVIAPWSGKVVFAGDFKSEGEIVIIEPQKGYSILITGLGSLDLRTGQTVAAGEPIGRMSGPARWSEEFLFEERPSGVKRSEKLYMEISRNRRPLNTAPWFQKVTERVSGL